MSGAGNEGLEDADDDGEADEDAAPSGAARPRQPAGFLAFLIASAIAVAFVYSGCTGASEGGCDGGTCLVSVLVGIQHAVISWVVAFPLAWVLIAAVRRS